MHYGRTAARFVALLAAIASCAAAAQRQTPQWSMTFDNRALTSEQAQADLGASWARLGDGSTLLASQSDSDVIVRGLGADGSALFAHTVSEPTRYQYERIVLLAANADASGAYVAASTTNPTTDTLLYRTSPAGNFDTLLRLPDGAADGAGPAVALRTLPDDSVLVLRRRAITRIAGDGQLLWNFGNGEDGHHLLDASDMALAPDGTIWVTARGGVRFSGSPAPYASVRRFQPGGQQLAQDLLRCASCSESRATGVTVLPDGQAVVVGRSAFAEPGFVAFYAANGTRRLFVETLPGGGYDRVVHDDAGNVYALSRETNTVSALDPADGHVRWQRAGSDISALVAGVLISQVAPPASGALAVDAVDAAGQLQWTTQLEASDGTVAGGARRVDGGIALLMQIERVTQDCGSGPRVVTLDGAGTIVGNVAGCLTLRSLYLVGTEAQPGIGVLASVQRSAVSLTPSGARRWQFDACYLCRSDSATTDAVALLPDGAAWLFGYASAQGAVPARHEFVHLDPAGNVRSRTALPVVQGIGSRAKLLGTAAQAIALVPGNGGLHWIRATADGGPIARQFVDIPGDYDTMLLTNTKQWPNGSVSLAVYTRKQIACQVSPGTFCRPPAYHVLRLNADGTERWRVEAGEGFMFVGFDDDGSALIASTPEPGPLTLRQIGANGVPGAPFVVAGGETMYLSGAAGPVRGRYLAVTETEHVLIDRNGTVLARRPYTTAWGSALANNTQHGFITAAIQDDGALVSADDLSVRAQFDIDGIDGALWDWPANLFWSLLDDGSIYTSARRPRDAAWTSRARISRFAVPGTPAADAIFIHHFD